MSTFEPWPDNMPLVEQVKALGAILMEHYPHTFDRSEGAMEKAARLLWEAAKDGAGCAYGHEGCSDEKHPWVL